MGQKSEKKQRNIDAAYNYIIENIMTKGTTPTVREIGKSIGVTSTRTVYLYLDELEAQGKIRRSPGKKRNIELAAPLQVEKQEVVNIPLLSGVKVDGERILITEDAIEDYFTVQSHFLPDPKANYIMLRTNSDSMINVGICEGDYVIVEQTANVKNGDIAVVYYEGATIIRTYFKEDDKIRLQAEAMDIPPILIGKNDKSSEKLIILGRVASVYRIV